MNGCERTDRSASANREFVPAPFAMAGANAYTHEMEVFLRSAGVALHDSSGIGHDAHRGSHTKIEPALMACYKSARRESTTHAIH